LAEGAKAGQLTKAQQDEYNWIDNVVVEAQQLAGNGCQKIKAGTIQWQSQVTCVLNKILYWKGLQKKIAGSCIGTLVLHSQAKKGGFQHELSNIWLSPETIKTQLTKAQNSFAQLKQDTKGQDMWLAGLIEVQATAYGMSKWLLWKQLQVMEQQACQMARVVRATLAELVRSGGPSMVIGLDSDAGCKVFEVKGDLEQACIKEAGWQFTQASNTPLLSSLLVDLLGETGKGSPSFKQILEGTFNPPMVCNPFAAKLLRHLY